MKTRIRKCSVCTYGTLFKTNYPGYPSNIKVTTCDTCWEKYITPADIDLMNEYDRWKDDVEGRYVLYGFQSVDLFGARAYNIGSEQLHYIREAVVGEVQENLRNHGWRAHEET